MFEHRPGRYTRNRCNLEVLCRKSRLTTQGPSGNFLTCSLLLFAVVVAPTSSRWVSDRTVIEGFYGSTSRSTIAPQFLK
jgi:hypothetical protein